MQVLDLLYSNMRLVPFPLKQVQIICIYSCYMFLTFYSVFKRYQNLTTTLQDWGAKVRAVHIAGAYWAPGFANYLILLQVFNQPISKQ